MRFADIAMVNIHISSVCLVSVVCLLLYVAQFLSVYVTLPSKMSHIDTLHEILIFTHL